MNPQISLTLLSGSKLPPVDCIANTNVAESADVIKNVLINKTAKIETKVVNGKCSNMENNDDSVPKLFISSMTLAPLKYSRLIPEPPKTVNHNAPKIVGTNNTPETNSLIVLPRDTRAIKVPTKGAQAIHHAQ